MRFSNGGRIVGAGTAEQSVNKGNDYKKGDNNRDLQNNN